MLKIDHISGINTRRVQDFSYLQSAGETHILLCPSVKFLDELQEILQKKISLSQGCITLDGKNYLANSMRREIQVIGSGEVLFPELTVLENVFRNESLYRAGNKRNRKRFGEMLRETDYQVNENVLVQNLSGEHRKIVEILYCYHMKPRLLVVRELSTIVSYETFTRFLDVIEKLNKEGVTVLYLTSQWEETLKVGKDVTLVMNGKQQGNYSAEEVRKDPSVLCYVAMGGQNFQERYVKSDMQYDLFRTLTNSIPKVSAGKSIHYTLQMFVNYLAQALNTDSAVVYLLDKHSNQIIDSVGYAKEGENPKLKRWMICNILNGNKLVYLNKDDFSFEQYFDKKTTNQTILCYPINVNDSHTLLLQMGYEEYYAYTKRDTIIIEWVAQEMSVFIENSRLMGKSLLLRESHHRIKNNLQIIVSLMEMEKERSFSKINDQGIQREIENAFNSAIGRIKCIAQIHDLLTKESSQNSFMDMHTIVKAVSVFFQSSAVIHLQFDSIYVPYSKSVSVALVVNEIMSNSVKHNSMMHGELVIDIVTAIDLEKQIIHLICRDNGAGFPCENGTEFTGQSDGLGMLVIDSVIGMEFEGEYHFYNDNGAVADIIIPQKALLPIEKREMEE